VNRSATGHPSRNKLPQVVRIRFWIEKSGAKEIFSYFSSSVFG